MQASKNQVNLPPVKGGLIKLENLLTFQEDYSRAKNNKINFLSQASTPKRLSSFHLQQKKSRLPSLNGPESSVDVGGGLGLNDTINVTFSNQMQNSTSINGYLNNNKKFASLCCSPRNKLSMPISPKLNKMVKKFNEQLEEPKKVVKRQKSLAN